jgi:hypothetical protein
MVRHQVTRRKTTIECSLQLLSKPRIKVISLWGYPYFWLRWRMQRRADPENLCSLSY